jgi:hypothetical protein
VDTVALHLMFSLNSMLIYTALRGAVKSSKDASSQPLDYVRRPSRGLIHQVWVTLTFILLVISFAVINATLLSFFQGLYEPSFMQQPNMLLLAPITVFIFLVCRYGDYEICRRTHRERSLRHAIFYQLILLSIRACVRILVTLSPIMAFQVLHASEEEQKFGSKRYQWLGDSRQHFSFTTMFGLALPSVLFMIVGYRLLLPSSEEKGAANLTPPASSK